MFQSNFVDSKFFLYFSNCQSLVKGQQHPETRRPGFHWSLQENQKTRRIHTQRQHQADTSLYKGRSRPYFTYIKWTHKWSSEDDAYVLHLTLGIQYKHTLHTRPQEIVKRDITRDELGADWLNMGDTGAFILPNAEVSVSGIGVSLVTTSLRKRRWTKLPGTIRPPLNCSRMCRITVDAPLIGWLPVPSRG